MTRQALRKSVTAATISCENVDIGYAGVPLLRNINLTVRRGMFLPFVGPNGSGKTTLLRTILGLMRPLCGRIRTPFGSTPPGYVSQQKTIDALYPVSALDIVMMGAYRQLGWQGQQGRAASQQRCLRLLAEFGLEAAARKTFSQLSGGMRQKVIVCRALAGEPDVLVMDEPTTELDWQSQRDVVHRLRRAAAEEGRIVLMVHHGLDIIGDMAKQVCLVHGGRAKIVPVPEARF